MSQRRAKAKRASVVPKVLSLADRASAALDEQVRRVGRDAEALKRSARDEVTEGLRRLLVESGVLTIEQAGKLLIAADVSIHDGSVYATPYAEVESMRFSMRLIGKGHPPQLVLERQCQHCGAGGLWTSHLGSLAALGMALKAKWQHPEGTCPRATESPRHSRHARKRT